MHEQQWTSTWDGFLRRRNILWYIEILLIFLWILRAQVLRHTTLQASGARLQQLARALLEICKITLPTPHMSTVSPLYCPWQRKTIISRGLCSISWESLYQCSMDWGNYNIHYNKKLSLGRKAVSLVWDMIEKTQGPFKSVGPVSLASHRT